MIEIEVILNPKISRGTRFGKIIIDGGRIRKQYTGWRKTIHTIKNKLKSVFNRGKSGE